MVFRYNKDLDFANPLSVCRIVDLKNGTHLVVVLKGGDLLLWMIRNKIVVGPKEVKLIQELGSLDSCIVFANKGSVHLYFNYLVNQ